MPGQRHQDPERCVQWPCYRGKDKRFAEMRHVCAGRLLTVPRKRYQHAYSRHCADATSRKGWGGVGHVNVRLHLRHCADATSRKGWGGVGHVNVRLLFSGLISSLRNGVGKCRARTCCRKLEKPWASCELVSKTVRTNPHRFEAQNATNFTFPGKT